MTTLSLPAERLVVTELVSKEILDKLKHYLESQKTGKHPVVVAPSGSTSSGPTILRKSKDHRQETFKVSKSEPYVVSLKDLAARDTIAVHLNNRLAVSSYDYALNQITVPDCQPGDLIR